MRAPSRGGRLAALVAAALAAACASPGGRWVTAEGLAPAGAAGPAAWDAALADARRRAVEAGAGVEVSARSATRDGVSAGSAVDAAARGRLLEERVLSRAAEGGLARVRLRARVLAPEDAGAVALAFEDGAMAAGAGRALRERGLPPAARAGLRLAGRAETGAPRPSLIPGSRAVTAAATVELKRGRRVLRAARAEASGAGFDDESARARAVEAASYLAARALWD